MKICNSILAGVHVIKLEAHKDSRGYFSRTFCAASFEQFGLNARWVQSSVSFTRSRGMLRGLHYQLAPSSEIKLIQCLSGSVFDVIVDLRKSSATFRRWVAIELSESNNLAIYVPEGCAHGFQCLTDECRMHYQMSKPYEPALSAGVRWNDPSLGIQWPIAHPFVSSRDAALPFLGGKP